MKRLIAAAILTALIIGICIAGNVIVKEFCKDTNSEIEICRKLCEKGDWEAVDKKVKDLKKSWKTRQRYMSVFVNHGIIDDISVSVSRMPLFSNKKSKSDFLAECAEINMLIDRILGEQEMNIESFF
ncbi:MAG: DUF4363 family protein [Clostridia bacterium]|nr:DUF4363 family protein [Clostridia bacterium]